MSQISLTEMVDILPAITLNSTYDMSNSHLFWVATIVFFIVLLLFFLWRYTQQPLRKLKHQLQTQQLSPREVAHRLAQIIQSHHHDSKIVKQLETIRFQRQTPDIAVLLMIIELYQHGK